MGEGLLLSGEYSKESHKHPLHVRQAEWHWP